MAMGTVFLYLAVRMRTIPQLFESSVSKFKDNDLILEKVDGTYQGKSYLTIANEVYALASGLIRLGVKEGDRIALLAEGRSEWLISELAILYIGAISVPLSVKINEESDLHFRLEHSGSRFIIVSDQQLDKAQGIFSRLTSMEKIILMDAVPTLKKNELLLSDILEDGRSHQKETATEVEKRWKSVGEDDLANISYTSGTTADPKGIMLTHRNYTANLEQANSIIEVPQWYNILLILSWDHSFTHTTGLYVLIRNGASIGVVEQGKTAMESLRNIPKNIKEVKPVVLLSVPALARSFKKNIEAGVKAKGNQTERLFNLALKTSFKYHGDGWEKKSISQSMLKLAVWMFDKLLFSKIRENFGGRLKFFIGGGALLDIELQRFFYAIGIPMYQGYGLTEASPVISSNTPDTHKMGTSGRVVENLQIRILDEDGNECPEGSKGEIVVKGENVMKGYWQNESATDDTLRDGWLHTGDLGYLDPDGFLCVLGRYKSLLIGNDGEKYSPEGIEETLIDNSELIDQCMLYNNQNPFTVGLFVINKASLKKKLSAKGIDPKADEALTESVKLIEAEFSKYQPGGEFENMFPQRWLPSAIGIVVEPFSEQNGLINSTLKMVRPKVAERYHDLLEYVYTPEGKQLSNKRNSEAIRMLTSA